MNYETIRKWYGEGKNERILDALKNKPSPCSPLALFYVAAALINLGKEQEAAAYLGEGLSRSKGDLKADFLALQAFLHSRRGDLVGYLMGAQDAVNTASTPLTLYHLGLALPNPEEGLQALQAALVAAEEAKDSYTEARNAHALAITLLRLGRYREALHWTRYAEIRSKHPGLKLGLLNTRAYLQVLLDEVGGIEVELRAALVNLGQAYPGVQELLPTTLADLLQAEGRHEEALAIYQERLQDAPRTDWPLLAHGAVRSLAALGEEREAVFLAETALVVAGELSPYHRTRARLALGIALWPKFEAHLHLEEVLNHVSDQRVPLATEAALHLTASHLVQRNEALAREVYGQIKNIGELGSTGLKLLGGRALSTLSPFLEEKVSIRAYFLGRHTVYLEGRPLALRPKGMELLTLLLSSPAGLSGEALSEALYGELRLDAVRIEIHRLRAALQGGITNRPYRLTLPVWADFIEIERLLRKGNLREAVALYEGPLLPKSEALRIVELRRELEAELQGAVLARRDPEIVWGLSQVLTNNLEVWEPLSSLLPEHDPRYAAIVGRVARIRQELEI